jgi:CRISPR-associated protein Cmr2
MTYTTVTFAPVQSFILASRKLRDLYGSSLLLSHLARALADDATSRALVVISPASVDSSRGVPNVLVIQGDYRKGHARDALLACWKGVLTGCRIWLVNELKHEIDPVHGYLWESNWKACAAHSWELFHGQGTSIDKARQALAINKQQRDWSVPNWTGESSTLSSAEAVVWPRMGEVRDPRDIKPIDIKNEARKYLDLLRKHTALGEAFADENEEISLTELVKRLVTFKAVVGKALVNPNDTEAEIQQLIPPRFEKASTRAKEAAKPESIVWFMADGDGVSVHLKSLKNKIQHTPLALDAVVDDAEADATALKKFSADMRDWAADLYRTIPADFPDKATVVYAGGDDLFGALHESEPGDRDLFREDLWKWLQTFPDIWKQCDQEGLTVSMGLVWADANVPQREALQHARDAEASAKARGKDRFALRLLYASGNHLEWTCPWEWLGPILEYYTDREGRSNHPANRLRSDGLEPSWRHLAEDLQWLQRRQAIATKTPAPKYLRQEAADRTARTLWQAYFPGCVLPPQLPKSLASQTSADTATNPGDAEASFRASFEQPEEGRRFDQWLLDLGLVMAGLEKHAPPMVKTRRNGVEVAA